MRIVISLIAALLPAFASGEVRAQLSLPDAPTALHAQEATRAFVQPLDLMNPKLAIGELQQIDCPTTRPSVRGNDVELTLTMKYSEHLIRNPDSGFIRNLGSEPTDRVYLRTYYDCPVGPTLTVRPGNRLKVLLKNDLPPNDPSRCPLVMNTPDCFNTGNLHTHGLHVSPAGNGDNVFVRVEPGQSFPYEYNIPSDHPAGTFWYHSHRHGSTALSVSSGMEGVLIVKGERRYEDRDKNRRTVDIDTILHDENGQDFKERVLLFQQISYGCFLDSAFQNLRTDSAGKWKCEKDDIGVVENYTVQFGPQSWVNSGRYTGINGKVQPLWQASVGEIERWRLVHGGVRDTINLRIVRATESPVASLTPGTGTSFLPTASINFAAANAVQQVTSGAEALLGNRLQTFVDQSCGVTDSTATATQFEIAIDGLTRREISEKTVNYLNPGQRSDILVFFPEPGLYCVLDQEGPGENTVIRDRSSKSRRLLALVVVSGGQSITAAPRTHLSSVMAAGNKDLPLMIRNALAAFDISAFAYFPPHDPSGDLSTAGVTGHPSALFNVHLPPADKQHADMLGRIQNDSLGPEPLAYAHDQRYTAVLGSVDEWTFGSWKGSPDQDPATNHVFHIHVNPFQIMDIKHVTEDHPEGVSIFDADHRCMPTEQKSVPFYCDQYPVFRDTMFVRREYLVIARTRYDDYVGDFVIHCHMLEHEDQGMMQNVTVVPPSKGH